MMKDNIDRRLELITTDDGSHSLYVPELNETYHSFHGAVQESKHVFIKMGLDAYVAEFPDCETIRVLEIGLGTGLNVLLTAQWAFENAQKVKVTSLEAYPINPDFVEQLNYSKMLTNQHAETWFKNIHSGPWNKNNKIHEWLELIKIESKLEDYRLQKGEFDVVFYDAFAPNKQAELWEIEVLGKVFKSQSVNGLFVTYCAKGQLKRDLRDLGYEVETLPGPPGKKEMVRGRVAQVK